MEKDIQERGSGSLGDILRKARIDQGLDIDQVKEETKISGSNIRAMETDDFSKLPADVFARGFYALYAKTLKLDPDEIVSGFFAAKGKTVPQQQDTTEHVSQTQTAKKISSMAEPSNVSPLSTLGFVLLLLIVLIGGICWYLDINPATFISEKLRGVPESTTPVSTPAMEEPADTRIPAEGGSKTENAVTLPEAASLYASLDPLSIRLTTRST